MGSGIVIWTSLLCLVLFQDNPPHPAIMGSLIFIGFVLQICGLLSFFKLHKKQGHKIAALNHRNKRVTSAAYDFLIQQSIALRRPLQGLVGIQDLFSKETSIKEVQDFFDIADFCSKFIVRQLNRIQFFSELENGKMRFEKSEFHLQTLVEDAVAIAIEQSNVPGSNIHIEISPKLPKIALGYTVAMKNALTELVNNALVHAHESKLTIKASIHPDNENGIIFSVSDNGVGLSLQQIRKLRE